MRRAPTTRGASAPAAALAAAALALLLCGCAPGQPADPLKAAITEKVMEVNPDVVSFTVTQTAKVKDVTLADELDRRTALFESKMRAETRLAQKYRRERMPGNAARHEKRQLRTADILIALEQYRGRHAAQLDSVLYTVMEFRGYGETAGGEVISDARMSITVTSDLTIYNLVPSQGGNPYTGMGVTIPGYRELVTQFRDSDETGDGDGE